MMSDAIDDALDDDDAEEETDELTNQVCFSFLLSLFKLYDAVLRRSLEFTGAICRYSHASR